tara:strand:- start:1197 stop:1439 length:243 start_codon:yes stop_codon:yes gene_type:complete
MTPKEKADELIEKMFSNMPKYLQGKIGWETAKQCALICVDDTLEALEHNHWQNKDWINHYKEVKQEIEKADISNYMRISE